VRNESGSDIFNWGPRPAEAQQLVNKMKAENADFETIKVALQNWHNNDKGLSLCRGLNTLFKQTMTPQGK
jgi:hypothetical protein